MGGRSVSPFAPVPSSRIFPACSSVTLGSPAKAGAVSGQFGIGGTGRNQIGGPRRHAAPSSSPSAFRGVWHSEHFATSSTRYRPRSISLFVGGAGSANRLWNAFEDPAIKAVITTTDTTVSLNSPLISPHLTHVICGRARSSGKSAPPLEEPIF